MIDKKISVGTLITLCTVIGTFVYTQGILDTKIDVFEASDADKAKSIQSNSNKIQNLEVGQERIETKIDEVMKRFDRLETLIMEM
jgi:hypothetical protein